MADIQPSAPASLPIAALAACCAVTMLVALFPGRRRGGGSGSAPSDPGAWPIALSILATLFSLVSMLETTGATYRDGSVGISLGVTLAITVASMALIGGRFADRGRPDGEVTLAQSIASHYGRSPALTLLVTSVGLLFTLAVVVLQLATVDAVWATIAPGRPGVCVPVVAGLAATTALGGRRGLTRALSLQGGWSLLTLLVTASFLAGAAWGQVEVPTPIGQEPAHIAWASIIPAAVALALQPALWLRYREAASSATLRRATFLVLILGALGFLVFAGIIGAGARAVYPPRVDDQWNQRPNAIVDADGMGFDRVLPVLLIHRIPTSLGAAGSFVSPVVLAGLFAASIGATSANLRAIGLLLALDVPLGFGRRASGGTKAEWASRILGALVASAAAWLVVAGHRPAAFRPLMLVAEVAILGPALLLQLLPVTIDHLYLGRGNRRGAAAGLVVGTVVLGGFSPVIALIAGTVFPAAAPPLARMAEHLDPALTALAANVATFAIVSLLARVVTARRPQVESVLAVGETEPPSAMRPLPSHPVGPRRAN